MSNLIQRLKDRISVIDSYVSDPASMPRRTMDERTLMVDAIAALEACEILDALFPPAQETSNASD